MDRVTPTGLFTPWRAIVDPVYRNPFGIDDIDWTAEAMVDVMDALSDDGDSLSAGKIADVLASTTLPTSHPQATEAPGLKRGTRNFWMSKFSLATFLATFAF